MNNKTLLRTGIIGALLVILLGAVGLSAALGWLDYVLFPTLVIFIAIAIYALIRRQREGVARRAEP